MRRITTTILREFWPLIFFPRQKELHNFDAFWERSLQAGLCFVSQVHRHHARAHIQAPG